VALGKPFIVVLNKIDLVAKADRDAVIKSAAKGLRLEPSQIIDTVATDGTNVGRVILAVANAEPGLLAALAEALPEYRSKLAWGRIVPAGAAAATVALVPLPLADVIPLLAIQTGLVLSISRIYGFQITVVRARELIATFGVAMIARTTFQQLSKLGGVPGWLLSSAIATSATVAIGYAAMTWFARGERPSQDAFRRQFFMPGSAPRAMKNEWYTGTRGRPSERSFAPWYQFQSEFARQLDPRTLTYHGLWILLACGKQTRRTACVQS
jgi:uncharacterized protein (DUF697 family)